MGTSATSIVLMGDGGRSASMSVNVPDLPSVTLSVESASALQVFVAATVEEVVHGADMV